MALSPTISDSATAVDLDELTRLAVDGDPDAPLPSDAVPWQPDGGDEHTALPDWYMPRPVIGASQVSGWRRVVAWTIIAASLAVVASGLCNTYGELVIA